MSKNLNCCPYDFDLTASQIAMYKSSNSTIQQSIKSTILISLMDEIQHFIPASAVLGGGDEFRRQFIPRFQQSLADFSQIVVQFQL